MMVMLGVLCVYAKAEYLLGQPNRELKQRQSEEHKAKAENRKQTAYLTSLPPYLRSIFPALSQ